MANKTAESLLLLFQNPQEPIFKPKGDKNQAFSVPNNFLAERFQSIQPEVENRFGEETQEKISVNTRVAIPNLGEARQLGRDENFSLFIPRHQRCASSLINIFMGVRNTDDLLAVAVFARDRCNPYMFNYALSVALLHRKDTKNITPPTFMQVFPDKFMDSRIFVKAREQTYIDQNQGIIREPIEIPKDYTASDREPEHRVAYWREDIGLNVHHWHWHLVYPFQGNRTLVDKNRRGELFFFMHQQIIARYDFERLCNQLPRVVPYFDFNKPIEPAYFSKLDSLVASRPYPGRTENQRIQDLRRDPEGLQVTTDDMIRWKSRIMNAIDQGFVTDLRNNRIELTEFEGIDILGNILESSILSPNQQFYGSYHNFGHLMMGYMHDPDNRHLETFAPMGDPATTMRDPMFYPWHKHIDDIFQLWKNKLPRYTVQQLEYQGVTVDRIEVQSQGGSPNVFNTFWQQSDVELSRGMDFQQRGSVFVRFTHIRHTPFNYNITVSNNGNNRRGTCRIFLAPKFDGRGNPWRFTQQKIMFIEMDRFTVNLKQGRNTITRSSTQSSITVPFEQTFRNLDNNRPTGGDALEQFNFCGCGWPDHMLVPKGTEAGMPCQLFVMISDYKDDSVNQTIDGSPCSQADSFCGIKDKLYPDRRSMGYPFDRMPRNGVDNLQQFLTPNMRVQDVIIKHTNRTVKGPQQRN